MRRLRRIAQSGRGSRHAKIVVKLRSRVSGSATPKYAPEPGVPCYTMQHNAAFHASALPAAEYRRLASSENSARWQHLGILEVWGGHSGCGDLSGRPFSFPWVVGMPTRAFRSFKKAHREKSPRSAQVCTIRPVFATNEIGYRGKWRKLQRRERSRTGASHIHVMEGARNPEYRNPISQPFADLMPASLRSRNCCAA
jgi:hypothetical protein